MRGTTGALLALGALLSTSIPARAASQVACPPEPVRVVRSAGGVIDYLGTAPGVAQLCRQMRSNGPGDYYFGIWRDDWPGAGQAFPAITRVLDEGAGANASFVTRSIPGMQWIDSYKHEGFELLSVGDHVYRTVRLAHGRQGIEGNTYSSVITLWIDVASGMLLKAVEHQIAGQSYGPDATWTAVKVEPIP